MDIEGGLMAGAHVWVSRFPEPSVRLAETVADSRGNFTLRLPEGERTSELIVRALTSSRYEGCELPHLLPLSRDYPLQLRLRRPEENYDEPSMDAVDDWLLERFKLAFGPKLSADSASGMIRVLRQYKRRNPAAQDRVAEALAILRNTNGPEVRLVAAAALMRLGAWQSADEVLVRLTDPHFNHERAVLEGMRLNFLRYPDEAGTLLEQTLQEDKIDRFAQLELGRAAVLREDWSGALQHLDPAMNDKNLAPRAHYLRARCLFALGDIESASEEANVLTRMVKKKRLPGQVRAFVEDLKGRLEERSLVALTSVITQPVSELAKAVPSLSKIDTSPPPPGQDLAVILKTVGDNIEQFFREFSNTSSLEVLRQSSLDNNGRAHAIRRVEMYYVIQQKSTGGRPQLAEIRGTADGKEQGIGGLEEGFMVTTGFASSLIIFHPLAQRFSDYRYLGREDLAGKSAYVVAFAQRRENSLPLGMFRSPSRQAAAEVFVQGLAWISADRFQVVRLRTDLLEPMGEVDLNRETSEIDYRPYRFLTTSKTYFLPSRVTVSIDWRNRRLRNEHIFSRYWLFNVEVDSGEGRRAIRSQSLSQPVPAQ